MWAAVCLTRKDLHDNVLYLATRTNNPFRRERTGRARGCLEHSRMRSELLVTTRTAKMRKFSADCLLDSYRRQRTDKKCMLCFLDILFGHQSKTIREDGEKIYFELVSVDMELTHVTSGVEHLPLGSDSSIRIRDGPLNQASERATD